MKPCFLEAFPNSFGRMQDLYGFDDKDGSAPLYSYEKGGKQINYFSNLESIDKKLYYNKYVNICIDGYWEGDNISEGFGLKGKLYSDTQNVLEVLSKRSEEDIRSVFKFLFDGPYPSNRKDSYNKLYAKIKKAAPSMAELLKEEYEKLLKEYNE